MRQIIDFDWLDFGTALHRRAKAGAVDLAKVPGWLPLEYSFEVVHKS